MREKDIFIVKTVKLLSIILLYYIVGTKNLFLYVLSLSLYEILSSFFCHISFKERLSKLENNCDKYKIYRFTIAGICIISSIFLLLGIVVSDIISILLNISDILLIFIFMGISVAILPLVKVTSEYYENINKNIKYQKLINLYYLFDNILLLIISLLVFRLFNVKESVAVSLLYLSKIISGLLILGFIYLINRGRDNSGGYSKKVNYYYELKKIFFSNNTKKIIRIVKNSYYYISIIVLYIILSTRYNYMAYEIGNILSFVYFYALSIIQYLVYIVKYINDNLPSKITIINKIYSNFRIMLSLIIFFGIISPIICKLLFNNSDYAIYLSMVNMMAIFVLLYDIVYENVNNKKVIYVSLIIGIISKLVLIVPLINSFYRMGYNLIYGDILSTIIGMFLSIAVNYIYIVNTNVSSEKYFEKFLKILFDNIVFCIVLVLIQFIIPMNTDNYFKALGLLWLYLLCIYVVIKIKHIKLRGKKRG